MSVHPTYFDLATPLLSEPFSGPDRAVGLACSKQTFLADVVGLEVGEEVLLARLEEVHGVVGDGDGAVATARAAPVEMLQHVGPATDLVLGR